MIEGAIHTAVPRRSTAEPPSLSGSNDIQPSQNTNANGRASHDRRGAAYRPTE